MKNQRRRSALIEQVAVWEMDRTGIRRPNFIRVAERLKVSDPYLYQVRNLKRKVTIDLVITIHKQYRKPYSKIMQLVERDHDLFPRRSLLRVTRGTNSVNDEGDE